MRRRLEGFHPMGLIMILVAAATLLVNDSVLLIVLKSFWKAEVFLRSFGSTSARMLSPTLA
jgi:hypothetical protein